MKPRLKGIKKPIAAEVIVVATDPGVTVEPVASEAGFDQMSAMLRTTLREALSRKNADRSKTRKLFDHALEWVGDFVVIYLENFSKAGNALKLVAAFPEAVNLRNVVPGTLGAQHVLLPPLETETMLIFEKVELSAFTKLGKYILEQA